MRTNRFMPKKGEFKKADSRLICSGCNIFMTKPIYMCPNGHNSCEECKYLHPCKICDFTIYSDRNYELELKTFLTLFPCRWNKKCGTFGYRSIRAHEAACQHRIYKCPALFCNFESFFSDVPLHIHLKHPYIEFHKSPIYKNTKKQDHMWFQIAYYELFICKFFLNYDTVSWSMHLQAPFSRAREFEAELRIGEEMYLLDLVNCFGPTYEIELTYDLIPSAQEFEFTLKVHRAANFIL